MKIKSKTTETKLSYALHRIFAAIGQASDKRLYALAVCLSISAFTAIYLQYSFRTLTKINSELDNQLESTYMRVEALLVEKSTLLARSRLEDLAEQSHMALPKTNNLVIYKQDKKFP